MTGAHSMGVHTNNMKFWMHPNTVASGLTQALAEGPKTAAELPVSPHSRSLAAERVDSLSVTGSGSGRFPAPLYYLYGDERQAARVFVRSNSEFVEEHVSGPGDNIIRSRLSEPMYRLLIEEHQLQTYTNE